jgi:hypothetical protein
MFGDVPPQNGMATVNTLEGMSKAVLTAVAWPYANGPRHIGHVSGFGVPSDVFARYRRMAGDRVLMVSGTDEHGTPIQVQADAEGLTPRQLADKYNGVITDDLQGLGLSYDLFTRTTTSNHYRVVQDMFTALYKNGYVVRRRSWGRSARPPAAPCPTATSRAPARSAATTAPAATSATTAATSSTRPTSRIRARGSTGRRRSSSRPSTSSSTCPPSPRRSAAGCRPAPTGAPTCSSSPPTWWRTSSRAPSPATWSGACPSRSTSGRTTRSRRSTSGSTPSSATCPPRWSGPAAARTRTRGSSGGPTRPPRPSTSWARTTSPSTR